MCAPMHLVTRARCGTMLFFDALRFFIGPKAVPFFVCLGLVFTGTTVIWGVGLYNRKLKDPIATADQVTYRFGENNEIRFLYTFSLLCFVLAAVSRGLRGAALLGQVSVGRHFAFSVSAALFIISLLLFFLGTVSGSFGNFGADGDSFSDGSRLAIGISFIVAAFAIFFDCRFGPKLRAD